jgi:hypothetical protein
MIVSRGDTNQNALRHAKLGGLGEKSPRLVTQLSSYKIVYCSQRKGPRRYFKAAYRGCARSRAALPFSAFRWKPAYRPTSGDQGRCLSSYSQLTVQTAIGPLRGQHVWPSASATLKGVGTAATGAKREGQEFFRSAAKPPFAARDEQ